MTIFGHFFANHIKIFHMTEVQTVILKCLTDLNLLWYKTYDQNAKNKSSANSQFYNWGLTHQNLKLMNSHFTIISGHFFANYVNIFHKTEIQTVILRCLMSLKLNWCKSYDTKCKNAENAHESFSTKWQRKGNGNICFLLHNFWTN